MEIDWNSKVVFCRYLLKILGSIEGGRNAGKVTDIIIGKTNKGNITLMQCQFYEAEYSTVPSESYKATHCFVGYHFNTKEQMQFSVAAVNYKYLEYWSCMHGFQKNLPQKGNKRGKKYIIEYKQPKPILLSKNKDLKISMFFSVSQNFAGKFNRSGTISEKTFLNFYFKKPQNYKNIESIIFSLKLFFTIAIAEKTKISHIDLWLNNSQEEAIKLYISECLEYDEHKTKQDSQMLFSFNDIKERVEMVFENWFLKVRDFKAVFELYYDIIYNEKRFGRTEFLNLVFALETIHRSLYKNEILSKEEFDGFEKRITETWSKKEFELFSDKVKYFNQPSLRRRLKDIYDEYEIAFKQFESNRSRFINYVVNTRNYYVHLDEKIKPGIIEDENLIYFNHLLRILLDLLVLSLLDFEKDSLPVLIKKSYGSRHIFRKRILIL